MIPDDNPGHNSDPEPDYDKDQQIRVLGVSFRPTLIKSMDGQLFVARIKND